MTTPIPDSERAPSRPSDRASYFNARVLRATQEVAIVSLELKAWRKILASDRRQYALALRAMAHIGDGK